MSVREWTFNAPGPGEGTTHALNIREWGDSTKPALICVHGLTRNARDFDFLAEMLSPDYRVICPDIAGRGKSAWLAEPMAYGYPLYVADMLALLAHMKLSRVDWIGTSMGGLIGLFIAAQEHSPIARLVLNDIGPFVAKEGLERIVGYVGRNTRYATREQAQAALRMAHAPFGIREESHWDHLFDASIHEDEGGVRLAYDPAIAVPLQAAAKEGVKDADLWAAWEKVQQPVLVLRGADSDILSAATATRMAQRSDVTRVEFPGIGHAPSLFDAAQLAEIRHWLKKANKL